MKRPLKLNSVMCTRLLAAAHKPWCPSAPCTLLPGFPLQRRSQASQASQGSLIGLSSMTSQAGAGSNGHTAKRARKKHHTWAL